MSEDLPAVSITNSAIKVRQGERQCARETAGGEANEGRSEGRNPGLNVLAQRLIGRSETFGDCLEQCDRNRCTVRETYGMCQPVCWINIGFRVPSLSTKVTARVLWALSRKRNVFRFLEHRVHSHDRSALTKVNGIIP